jgi:hypothetical protein
MGATVPVAKTVGLPWETKIFPVFSVVHQRPVSIREPVSELEMEAQTISEWMLSLGVLVVHQQSKTTDESGRVAKMVVLSWEPRSFHAFLADHQLPPSIL